MSEIERLHQARLAREAEAKKRSAKGDPTEWHPRPNDGWQWVDHNVSAETLRTEPLYYESLADKTDDIAGIEANAKAGLIRTMDGLGITPDERGVRVHWALVVQGHGFKQPEGFIHPEAPDDVKREGREAWKRVVQIASDSLDKYLFVKVWRRKHQALPPAHKAIDGPDFQEILAQANAEEE